MSVGNLERWKSSGEPHTWVAAHLTGWNHQDWLNLLVALRKSQYWPMEEAAIGRHLEMLRADLLENNRVLLARLLSVEEPTIVRGPSAEPSDAGPLGLRFYSRGGGAEAYYRRIDEAERSRAEAVRFWSTIRSTIPVLGFAQEDLANLALNATSETVRETAAKCVQDCSIASGVFRQSQDGSVRACVVPHLTQPELIDIVRNDRALQVQVAAVAQVNDEAALESIAIEHTQEPVAISAAKRVQERCKLSRVARSAGHESVRLYAAEAAGDRDALKMLVIGGSDRTTRVRAAQSLGDVEQLRALVRTLEREKRKTIALELNDQILLAEWVLEQQGNDAEADMIIDRIGDPKLLTEIFLGAKEPLVAHAALKRVFPSAASDGNRNLVELLLAHGADVNCRSDKGETPLLCAARNRHKDLMELLLAHGADVDSKNYGLRRAASNGHKDVVELLLAHGADVNYKDYDGETPLHHAASNGHRDMVELLLAHGADVNCKSRRYGYDGRTPLHFAADEGHKDVVELLLANKAEVNAEDKYGYTPLRLANRFSHSGVVELLADAVELLAVLHIASRHGDLGKVTALLKNDPDLVFRKDEYGRTPLHLAAENGHEHVVELLLANKAEVNAEDKKGRTPLHCAAMQGWKAVVEVLLTNKAVVNAKDKEGETPLHCASLAGDKEMAELLLAHGADVNCKSERGETPLHCAARNGHKDAVELLLRKKAHVNAKDDCGYTPLHLAARHGRKEVIELLLANNGDVTAKDKDGYTPLDVAVSEGHKDVFSSRWCWFRYYLRKRLRYHQPK